MFMELKQVGSSEKVTLGDGSSLDLPGEGIVNMDMLLSDESRRGCVLKKGLYIPQLSFNLVSVSRAAEARKTVCFNDSVYKFQNESGKIIAVGVRHGSLYYLKVAMKPQENANMAQKRKTRRDSGTIIEWVEYAEAH